MQLRDSGRFNVTSKMFGDGKLMRECCVDGGGVVNCEEAILPDRCRLELVFVENLLRGWSYDKGRSSQRCSLFL